MHFSNIKNIYFATRKRNDQLFNTYFMRPIAAVVVASLTKTRITPNQLTIINLILFMFAMVCMVLVPSRMGGILAIAILELSYLFDCADGMLARHRNIASKQGHLFDFFTDEIKATSLVSALSIRFWSMGGLDFCLNWHGPKDSFFLLVGTFGTFVIASAISITSFSRRPEISGQESSVEAYYESHSVALPTGILKRCQNCGFTFLRFLNHYPSHIWIFAILGRMDLFLLLYLVNNSFYLLVQWAKIIRLFWNNSN